LPFSGSLLVCSFFVLEQCNRDSRFWNNAIGIRGALPRSRRRGGERTAA
jgi:hypothetical protein